MRQLKFHPNQLATLMDRCDSKLAAVRRNVC